MRPPVVVRTEPEAFAVVTEVDEVRFEFDERISERVAGGTIDEAVTISPRSGAVRVSKGRRSLSVKPEGGFRSGLVYRVTVQPVVSDMFGNRLADPFELVFSTGGEPVPTTLAGEVWDRITGRGLSGATVYATSADGLVHEGSTDQQGIFALRYVPEGDVSVTAFDDVNRNGEVDSTEVQGGTTVTLAPGDTLLVDFPVLEPDTSSANLMSAESLDSITVTLTFDDFLDPDMDVDGLTVELTGDSVSAPDVTDRWQEADYTARVTEIADSLSRLDSIRAEEAAQAAAAAAVDTAVPVDSVPAPDSTGAILPDTAGQRPAPPDTVVIGAAPAPADRGWTALERIQGEETPGLTADGARVLPGRRIVLRLDAPLPYDVPFEVSVDGVVNIYGLTGGGGSAELVRPSPPPDTASADSSAIDLDALDSIGVDTGAVDPLTTDTGVVGVGPVEPSGRARRGRR
jgi:hypothetical protein